MNRRVSGGATGRAAVTIVWPAASAAATSRLIPAASQSITVSFTQVETVVATQTVARPTSGNTSTLSFTGLPAGTLLLSAGAYPTTSGTGVQQAGASISVTIVADQTINSSITMATTITSMVITPAIPSVVVGAKTTLLAAAYDKSGNVVLTTSTSIVWSSSATGVATVDASTGQVTGVAAGTATITVKDSESGISGTTTVTVTASSVSCVAFPTETEGPYWVDTGLTRSDVRVSAKTDTGVTASSSSSTGYVQAGVPLTLQLYLVNVSSSCAPITGAVIDIWHANATGIYSDEPANNNSTAQSTSGQTWLRGNQTTDSTGLVTFTTIYPGWYVSRTTHIHFRCRFTVGGKSYNVVSQLFFTDAQSNTVYTTNSAYTGHGTKDTTNARDMVYNSPTTSACSGLVLSLTGSATTSFTSSFVLGIAL